VSAFPWRSPIIPLFLVVAPAPLLAQRDVGPARVALFAGARLTPATAALVGLAGELELKRTWTLAAAVSVADVSGGNSARYELDGRWRPAGAGPIRPYVGAGVALTRSSAALAGGPTSTHVGGLALVGVEVPLLGTWFVEAVGVETGDFTAEVRGGVRLLVFGP
jgi:hypothetical protein